MINDDPEVRRRLLTQGRRLEWATLGWNVAGIVVLAIAAAEARSVALAGFGLDSLIEIGASAVVLWELAEVANDRQRRALRLIGLAFMVLAAYLALQTTIVLVFAYHPRHSLLGIAWTAVTAGVMFALAAGKAKTGVALDNPVLRTEGPSDHDRCHPGLQRSDRIGPQCWPRLVVGRPRRRLRPGVLRGPGGPCGVVPLTDGWR